MNRTIGSFAAGAAVVAVALIGYNVLAGQGKDGAGVGAPSSPEAIAPSPTPTPVPASQQPSVGGGLTVAFTAPAPDGWEQGDTTVTNGDDAEIEIFEDRSVMSAYPDCVYGPAAGIGRTASDIANALAIRDGLEVTGPAPVEVGGLNGQMVELSVTDGWNNACDWQEDKTIPLVPTFGAFDEKNNWLFKGVVGDERYRIYVLDKPEGGNVIVDAWASNDETWAANEADITSIVSGIEFDTGS